MQSDAGRYARRVGMRSYRVTTRRENGVTHKTVQSRGPIATHYLGAYKTKTEKQQTRRELFQLIVLVIVLVVLTVMLAIWIFGVVEIAVLTLFLVPVRKLSGRKERYRLEREMRKTVRAIGRGMGKVAREVSTGLSSDT